MATIISNIGTVAYNGYQFDGASSVTIRCEPVYDDANRTVIYHRYTINVKAIVADSLGTGRELQDIRYRLTKAGQSLTVYNQGFYNLFANASSPDGFINDVAFGPKPKLVSWTPLGSLYAAEVEWVCETCIAYCVVPKYHQGIMAFNYGVTYAIDVRGLTTRTIAGYFEIAMTRTAYTIPDCCDNYRTVVNPVIPERFSRTSQNYQLSLDKRRCDFSVVDTEIPSNNPYPNGVVKIDARHRVHYNRRGGQMHTLRNTISAEIEMAPDQPMLNAYAAFAAIVKKRIDIAKAAVPPPTHSQDTPGVLIDEFSAEESLFDRKCSFTCGYRVLQPLARLLADTGLWTPLELNTWAYWRASIALITDQRGYANMAHPANADSIIDPCGTSVQQTWDPAYNPVPQQSENTRELLKNDTPGQENSWMFYDAHIVVMRDRAVVRHAVLQVADVEDAMIDDQSGTELDYPAMGGVTDIIQRGGKSRFTVVLQGSARRAGYHIPKPVIQALGGASTVLKHDGFKEKCTGNYLGVPVWSATWKQVYIIGEAPGVVPPRPNLAEGVDAAGVAIPPVSP